MKAIPLISRRTIQINSIQKIPAVTKSKTESMKRQHNEPQKPEQDGLLKKSTLSASLCSDTECDEASRSNGPWSPSPCDWWDFSLLQVDEPLFRPVKLVIHMLAGL